MGFPGRELEAKRSRLATHLSASTKGARFRQLTSAERTLHYTKMLDRWMRMVRNEDAFARR